MTKPYLMVRLDGEPVKVDGGYRIRVELAQTAVVARSQEHLWIETQTRCTARVVADTPRCFVREFCLHPP
jgi:hypothetical protein